jgi:hypothetical protein
MFNNQKCPKCGSNHVQLSNVQSKHGFFWFLIFGWVYLVLIPIKWCLGLLTILCIDWWMALIKKSQGKGYVWKGKRWFSGRKKMYYCHECHHNFKG